MTRRITRYANRKLYDPRTRGYITLLDVAHAVAKGESVEVTDRDTEEDLTSQTLLQAMMEWERSKRGTIAASGLAAMLRKAGHSKKGARARR